MDTSSTKQYTVKDFKSDQSVRWCPGCGDFAVLTSLQRVMAEVGVPPHETAVISGIGCSSRLPYYINLMASTVFTGAGQP